MSQLATAIDQILGEDFVAKAKALDGDGSPNGIEVRGEEEVTGVGLGVTSSVSLFRKAKSQNLNTLITHHSLRLASCGSTLHTGLQNRLAYLLKNKMTLFGFHCTLDTHEKLGNNAQIMKKLGIKPVGVFEDWWFVGEFEKPKTMKAVRELADKTFDRSPRGTFRHGSDKIKRVVVCSGGGAPAPYAPLSTLLASGGVDLFITGDPKENLGELCKEIGLNVLTYGHYATETFGVKALGKELEKKFPKLPIEFIDVPDRF